jgi:hypothetical protein
MPDWNTMMADSDGPNWKRPEIISHTQRLLNSYRRWVGRELLPRDGSAQEQSRALYEASFFVVSDGLEESPIFNYGNLTAQNLFETNWENFTKIPSRQSAEIVHQAERERLRDQVTQNGFIDNYRGIRIATSGRRFWIEQAIVWVVVDESEKPIGKAATFSTWTFL